jgi:predicted nucleic-acid-binding Zn-ribbon protein
MMKDCPECGSNEIVSDLLVFSGDATTSERPPYVKLVEPEPQRRPFIWLPKSVASGFRAAICGACGYTRFYTKHHAEILEAHRKGYTSPDYPLKNILPI